MFKPNEIQLTEFSPLKNQNIDGEGESDHDRDHECRETEELAHEHKEGKRFDYTCILISERCKHTAICLCKYVPVFWHYWS